MQRRKARIDSLMREILNEVLRSRIADPRAAVLWTITSVDVSPDLKSASIGMSVLGDPDKAAEAIALFQKLSGFISSMASRLVNWRVFPSLRFRLDKSLEEALRLERLLSTVVGKDNA